MLEYFHGASRQQTALQQSVEQSLQHLEAQLATYRQRSTAPQTLRHEGIYFLPPQNLEGESFAGQVIFDRTKSFLNNLGYSLIEVEKVDGQASPNGVTRTDSNEVAIKSTLSENMKAKVALHEAAHIVLGHKDKKLDQNLREVEAEVTTHTVTSHFGLDTSSYSVPYIAAFTRWGRDKKMIRKVKSHITEAAQVIITGLEQVAHTQQ